MTMSEWRERAAAGLDPTAPREIGDLLRQEWRELGIPGAAAPGADSGRSPHHGPDHSADRESHGSSGGAYRSRG